MHTGNETACTGISKIVSAAVLELCFVDSVARIIFNTFFIIPSFQILTSVPLTSITVMPMLSAITLRGLITAHAALDTLEMEHHASVNYPA